MYQENVWYPDKFPFVSFRKSLLSSKMKDSVELISFHSVSKGIFGECGLRGGMSSQVFGLYLNADKVDKYPSLTN